MFETSITCFILLAVVTWLGISCVMKSRKTSAEKIRADNAEARVIQQGKNIQKLNDEKSKLETENTRLNNYLDEVTSKRNQEQIDMKAAIELLQGKKEELIAKNKELGTVKGQLTVAKKQVAELKPVKKAPAKKPAAK